MILKETELCGLTVKTEYVCQDTNMYDICIYKCITSISCGAMHLQTINHSTGTCILEENMHHGIAQHDKIVERIRFENNTQ